MTASVPVRYVYDQVAEASPGDTIIPVYGSARGADGRFERLANYATEGTALIDGGIKTQSVEEGGASGTMLRNLIKTGAREEFFTYMPDLSDDAKNKIWGVFSQPAKISLTEVKSLITNLILEIDAAEILKKIEDIDQSQEEIQNAMGALEKASTRDQEFKQVLQSLMKNTEDQEKEESQEEEAAKKKAKQITKYAKIRPEERDTSLEEMSSVAGGDVEGYGGPLFNKEKKKGNKDKMDTKETKLREFIQHQINLIVENSIEHKAYEENKLRHIVRNLLEESKEEYQLRSLVKNLTKEVILEQKGPLSEKEMFDLVKKEIAGVLKATIKILKSQQEGDPEQVQIGHLKATIVALNNLFDGAAAGGGMLSKLQLAELKKAGRLEVEIGDVSADITQSPEYMSPEAMENGGENREETEIDIEDSDHEDTEETTLDLENDDIKTLFDTFREGDPENASYQVLGAQRALDNKTGSWPKVKKIFLNYAERILEADLPKEAWSVFRKWVVENVRLHLIATIQETASGVQTSGEADLGMEDLGEEEPSGIEDLEF